MATDSHSVYKKILEVIKRVGSIQHEDKKVNNQYTFVSHDAVTEEIRLHCIDVKLIIIPTILKTEWVDDMVIVEMSLTAIDAENPTSSLEVVFWGTGIDSQDKGIGKATSYAYKYGLLKLFMCRTGDDPERDSINRSKAVKKKPESHREQLIRYISSFKHKDLIDKQLRIASDYMGVEKVIDSKYILQLTENSAADILNHLKKNEEDELT